jgi:hypothetical protein
MAYMIDEVRLLVNNHLLDGSIAIIREGTAVYVGPILGAPNFKFRDLIYVNSATYNELKKYTISLDAAKE